MATSIAALAVAVVAVVIALDRGDADSVVAARRPTASANATPSTPTTAEVYDAVAPSVVEVRAVVPTGVSLGTGVVAADDGSILTALHVVAGARSVRVAFSDGTSSSATVTTSDRSRDIATLKPVTLPSVVVPATLGGGVAVGDPVSAIGNPLGLTRSATAGIVSGLDRVATPDPGTRLRGLIQFDAAVNPGNSGGPLLDASGAVVGIVVALANPTKDDTFIGIGFAVPIGGALGAGGVGQGVPGPQY